MIMKSIPSHNSLNFWTETKDLVGVAIPLVVVHVVTNITMAIKNESHERYA